MEVKGIDLLNAMRAVRKEPPKSPRVAEVAKGEPSSAVETTTPPVAESAPMTAKLEQGELGFDFQEVENG